MEMEMYDVGEVNSKIGSRHGIPHIREMDDLYNVNESITDNDEIIVLESDDASSSTSLSEGVQAAPVIGYVDGL
eukprot:9646688-Ditylum_brightwellii.AAC.1